MNHEFEFCGFALQPMSGVGEAMYVAGVDGRMVDGDETGDVMSDDEGERY